MIRTLSLVKYHWFSLWNWRHAYLGRLIEPVVFFVFLAAGVAGFVGSDSEDSFQAYLSFAMLGIACLVAFRAVTATLSDVANDRKWGVYAIFSMQGGSTIGYLLSIAIIACGLFLAQILILFGLYWLIGGNALGGIDFLRVVGIGSLIVIGWVGVGTAIGTKVQSYARRNFLVTIISMPAVLAAPLFYPLESAPTYLRVIASFNPVTYQVGWLRLDDMSLLMASGAALGWAVIGSALAGLFLARSDLLSPER
ncbi:ABC transporter permease [Natronoglycomyces albus]|uniref:ABC transporter permease n=1 Tax=Natronoglycomyces albus TaxID=2811108 RepID=A0A895XHE9_9ACTN|nr:ABC transporter permease [Natronoglycomyces albus]QSB04357.1 ABC transporter permease [Natronoglycomyces albus]